MAYHNSKIFEKPLDNSEYICYNKDSNKSYLYDSSPVM